MKLRQLVRFSLVAGFAANVLIPAALAQIRYYLPQVADGAGLIQTTFVFVNNGSMDAQVRLSITDGQGNVADLEIPGLPAGTEKQFSLPAGNTRFFTTSGQGGNLVVGAAEVNSTVPIGVSAIFTLLKDGGQAVLTETGISASRPVNTFAIAVDTTGPFNTGLAVANLDPLRPATLQFRLYDTAGNLVNQAARQLPRRGQLALYVGGPGGLFEGLDEFRGRLVVQASTLVSALTLRQNAVTGAPLTTVPVVPLLSGEMIFDLPQIANGSQGGIAIKTQFLLFSLGAPATVTINLTTGTQGDPLSVTLNNGQTGSQFQVAVPAGGAVFLETTGTGPVAAGAAHVESSVPIGVSAIFSILNAEGEITTEAGVGSSEPLGALTIPIDTTSGMNTGVAVKNLDSSTAAELKFDFYDENGAPVGTTIVRNLDPLGHMALYADQLSANFSNRRGQLAVTANVPIAAIGLRQGVQQGTLTTLPVVRDRYDTSGTLPTDSAQLVPKTLTGLDFLQNSQLNVTLDAGFKISGQVNLPEGYFPLNVQAIDPEGETFVGTVQFGSRPNTYSVIVPPGIYDLRVCTITTSDLPFGTAGVIQPQQQVAGTLVGHVEPNIVANDDIQRNIQVGEVELRTISGTVQGLEKLPPGADPLTTLLGFTSPDSTTAAVAQLGPGGSFSVELAPGDYEALLVYTVGDPDSVDRAGLIGNLGQVQVGSADQANVVLQIPDLVQISGRVTQPDTADFSTSAVSALHLSNVLPGIAQCIPLPLTSGAVAKPSPDGNYTLFAEAGRTYDFMAMVPATDIGEDSEGDLIAPLPGSLRRSYNTPATLNLDLPAFPAEVQLQGQVTDPDGQPVAGATVTVENFGGLQDTPDSSFSASTVTGADGRYSLTVLAGRNYTVEVSPQIQTAPQLPFGGSNLQK